MALRQAAWSTSSLAAVSHDAAYKVSTVIYAAQTGFTKSSMVGGMEPIDRSPSVRHGTAFPNSVFLAAASPDGNLFFRLS